MPEKESSEYEVVINWHIAEACNFRCCYCYAKWDGSSARRDLVRDPERCTRLLEELHSLFCTNDPCNPFGIRSGDSRPRLNLAGGEPLLYRREALYVVREARRLGFDVSLITNASRLDDPLMLELAPQLIMLGISVDSADPERNRLIGRVDRHGLSLDPDRLVSMISLARNLNPGLRIKVNTVVNQLNFREDMTPLLGALAPDKWKILRMLPNVTDRLAVSKHQFDLFVDRHASLALPVFVEDNEDMSESYIMIDPAGRFFQNGHGAPGYRYSPPILDFGAAAAFAGMTFVTERYLKRYDLAEVRP